MSIDIRKLILIYIEGQPKCNIIVLKLFSTLNKNDFLMTKTSFVINENAVLDPHNHANDWLC